VKRNVKIRLDVEGTTLDATLDDTAIARDFASLLPLELSLDDYAATEKIADLAKAQRDDTSREGHARRRDAHTRLGHRRRARRRHNCFPLRYSSPSARTGSSRAARNAGSSAAASATIPRPRAATA
jgi:hypothetical protein